MRVAGIANEFLSHQYGWDEKFPNSPFSAQGDEASRVEEFILTVDALRVWLVDVDTDLD